MKKIKVFALLATLFVGIFSNLFTPVVSAADPEKVSITLHKVKDYKNDATANKITNTGEILTEDFNFLPGITFKVYDVTEEYYAIYDESVKTKPAADAIKEAAYKVQGTAGEAPVDKDTLTTKEVVDTQTTDTYGSATFSLNAKSGMTTGTKPVPRDAVYLFVEQPSDGVASTSIAENLVVSLPIYKQNTNDTVLKEIHLYPKNTTNEIPFDKEITDKKNGAKQTDFSIGQTINYQLKTTIPADIAATKLVNEKAEKLYNIFKFVDTFQSDQLSFINEAATFSVTVAGEPTLTLTQVTDYTVEVKENKDTGETTVTTALTAAGIDRLATLANKEISFDYQMKINSLQYVDTDIVNTAKAIFGNDGTTVKEWNKETKPDSETVKTGGYKFVKVDVNNNAKTLDGAKFVVRKSTADATENFVADAAEYFVADANGGVWTTDKDKATVYTSGETGEKGIVDVKGLEYGTYYLQETEAPEGYALPTGDVAYTKFYVTANSYKTTSNANAQLKIVNTPKGFLPSTGGAGIILFVALGAAMVGLAGVYFTSRRKDA
ncbi:TPA: SpaH/EbpB family LPXTG-anchored major pilin [Streptococcus suis]|nr:SpaH/EbpB family LPXTG-anchored major pilin [Streptococcus suis]HEM3723152.1 SpaH/EbpB family LPXTG-anchored major pilin [Streptococcus suis]